MTSKLTDVRTGDLEPRLKSNKKSYVTHPDVVAEDCAEFLDAHLGQHFDLDNSLG